LGSTQLLAQQSTANIQSVEFLSYRADTFNIDLITKSTHKQLTQLQGELHEDSTYWFQVNIESKKEDAQIITLCVRDKIRISYINFFIHKKEGGFEQINSGWFDKDILYRDYTNAAILLPIGPLESKTVYVRLKSIHGKVQYRFQLKNTQSWYENLLFQKNANAFFHGMLWIMVLYNILLWFTSRQKQYIYYAAYILTSSVQFLFFEHFTFEIFFRSRPELNMVFSIGALTLGPILYFLFVESFLDLQKIAPRWVKIFRILSPILIVSSTLQFIYWVTTYNLHVTDELITIQIGIVALLMLLQTYDLRRHKNITVQYFIYASLTLWGSIVVGAFLFHLDITSNPLMISQAGIIIEIVLFSIGLGHKMKINEEEKVKAQTLLIAQLKQNDSLREKVTRELEEAVNQRTLEIEKQKTSILQQNAELNEKQAEILTQTENLRNAFDQIWLQKNEIEIQNLSITSSIEYAKRIQMAVFPPANELQNIWPNSFLMLKPRDIVSGDFYWIHRSHKLTLVAVADCTGHGVPGAFMSMLGVSMLNNIVRMGISSGPGAILEQLRKRIKKALNQKGVKLETHDGIDMSLVAFNHDTNSLEFAGANSNIMIVSANAKEGLTASLESEQYRVYCQRGTPNPVGFYAKEIPFVSHKYELHEGERIYLYTDGYIDQFDQFSERRFQSRRFRQLVLDMSSSNMAEQFNLLEAAHNKWRKHEMQTDDILVVGIEF
jgi:serine phosphatase RsbU (regulator of sigma subunit)